MFRVGNLHSLYQFEAPCSLSASADKELIRLVALLIPWALSAQLKSDNPDQSTTIHLREKPRDGFRLWDLVCTNRSDGTPVDTQQQNAGNEFSFMVPTYADIVCEAKNAPSENFIVSKTAAVDQMPDVDGDQPNALVDQDGGATVYYGIAITNGMNKPVYLRGDVVDVVTPPENFRVVGLHFTLDD